MNAKQKFTVTTYFTYSITVEVEAENENVAWREGRTKAIHAPSHEMEYVGVENTLVMDSELNILCGE